MLSRPYRFTTCVKVRLAVPPPATPPRRLPCRSKPYTRRLGAVAAETGCENPTATAALRGAAPACRAGCRLLTTSWPGP
jgi:hypothetical protein